MILILKTHHLAFTFVGLAILFTLAGWSYSRHQQKELQASIVRAYFGAVEAEHRLDQAEHDAQDLEFIYEYAIEIASNEVPHD